VGTGQDLQDHAWVDRADVVQSPIDLLDERRVGSSALRTGHHEGLRCDVLLEPLLLEQRLRSDRLQGCSVKSKSVVRALLSKAPDAANPRTRITAQIATVRHCVATARSRE
jgi:hypothetical protein